MNTDLISIIIPVYNAEAHLTACIESVYNQSHQNFEIVIIDDGSTDDSLQIARSFGNDRIKVLSQKQHGAAFARNHGLETSNGKYIQFLDADDLLGKDKLKCQVELLQKNPGFIANCRTIHFKEKDNPYQNKPSSYEDEFYTTTTATEEFLIKLWGGYSPFGSMISSHSWLIPRAIIDETGGWNINLTNDDDGEFFTRIILKATGICYIKDVFVYYRKQENSSLSRIDSAKKLDSLLTSALFKTGYLLQQNDSEPAKLASYKVILDIAVKSYRKYPKIYERAISKLPLLEKNNYVPSLGGQFIQRIGKYFGWRVALFVQYYLKQIASR